MKTLDRLAKESASALRSVLEVNEQRWCPIKLSEKQKLSLELPHFEVLSGGAAGGGKLLKTNDLVLTPTGWKSNGDLKIGDLVTNPRTGGGTRIISIADHKSRDLYRVHFDDGSSIEAGDEHLWVYRRSGKKTKADERARRTGLVNEDSWLYGYKICTTLSLQKMVEEDNSRKRAGYRENRPHIPVNRPVEMTSIKYQDQNKRPIDPYILGLLLGDGCLSDNVSITTADEFIEAEVFKYLGGRLTRQERAGTRAVALNFRDGQTKIDLESLDLRYKKSFNKFIPDAYLNGPLEARFALIQGLIDTDGYVDSRGHISYTTISLKLAKDVVYLARSLGARANMTSGPSFYKDEAGNRVDCSEAYTVWIMPEFPNLFCRLPRKLERVVPSQHLPQRRVMDVEHVGVGESRCITLDSVDRLYIASREEEEGRDFIVTHNSAAMLAGALEYVHVPGYAAILFRRTYADLARPGALMDMAHEWLAGTAAKWNSQDKTWTFPSGAKLVFGYLETELDKYNYQGGAYQFAGFDEVSQIAESRYTYILSRMRKTTNINVPIRVRPATNPGGEHANWVKERFVPDSFVSAMKADKLYYEKEGINAAGENTTRAFVPYTLFDNKHLDAESYIKSLNELDAVTREQLLNGDWLITQRGDVFPSWDERRHVISWSQFQKVVGTRRIPRNWMLGIGMDAGATEKHPYAVSFVAMPPDSHPLAGTAFYYRSMTGFNEPPRAIAERIRTAQKQDREDERTRIWVMSHEAKSERDTFVMDHGLPFGSVKPDRNGGIDRVRDYLEIRGEDPDPFHPELQGSPSLYFIVDDSELFVPKTDGGLCRLRTEMPLYHYDDRGNIFSKQMNDCIDSMRFVCSIFLPMRQPISKRARLVSALESVRIEGADQYHSAEHAELLKIQQRYEQERVRRRELSGGSDAHPMDAWKKRMMR